MQQQKPSLRNSHSDPGTTVFKNASGIVNTLKRKAGPQTGDVDRVFESLKKWRKNAAKISNCSECLIFPERTLLKIANAQPRTFEELLKVHGVGLLKVSYFGSAVLNVIEDSTRKRQKCSQRSTVHSEEPRLLGKKCEKCGVLHTSRHVAWSTTAELLLQFRNSKQCPATPPATRKSSSAHDRPGSANRVNRKCTEWSSSSPSCPSPSFTPRKQLLQEELLFVPKRSSTPNPELVKIQDQFYQNLLEQEERSARVQTMIDEWFKDCREKAKKNAEMWWTSFGNQPSKPQESSSPFWIEWGGQSDKDDCPVNRNCFPFANRPDLELCSIRGLRKFIREAGHGHESEELVDIEDLRSFAREVAEEWEVNRVLGCSNLAAPLKYLAVLRIDFPVEVDEVRKAFRKMTLTVHPDKNASSRANDAFHLVQESLERVCERLEVMGKST